MPDKKKKKRKNLHTPTVVNIARLYNEDIGLEGLKKKRLSGSNGISFELPIDDQEESKRQKRMQRFVEHSDKLSLPDDPAIGGLKSKRGSKKKNAGILEKNKKLVGKSTSVEKPYMRLTTAPKASDVRPLPVLRMALSHVKAHFIENEDFKFANEQLKSIRQDITVQHLRKSFVLEVYEIHARMLLEHDLNLNEFNQCQTMIRSLTDSNNGKASKKKGVLRQSEEAADEFRAYSLLYDVVQNASIDLKVHVASEKSSIGTTNETNIVVITQGSSVRHALKVVKAVLNDDYLSFFRLYESAPHLSAYLMDYLVRRVRNVAYARIIAAYRPTFSTERFREVLAFHDLEEARRFLKKKGAIFLNDKDNPPFWVDCKATHSSYT